MASRCAKRWSGLDAFRVVGDTRAHFAHDVRELVVERLAHALLAIEKRAFRHKRGYRRPSRVFLFLAENAQASINFAIKRDSIF